jgi:sec-independent protein translocase protein TatA
MFDVGATELLVVAALAVMLYGGDLPDVARKAGTTVKRLRGVADDLKRQVTLPPEMQTGFREVRAELRKLPQDLDLRPDIAAEPEPRKPASESEAPAEPPPVEHSEAAPVDPPTGDPPPPPSAPPPGAATSA